MVFSGPTNLSSNSASTDFPVPVLVPTINRIFRYTFFPSRQSPAYRQKISASSGDKLKFTNSSSVRGHVASGKKREARALFEALQKAGDDDSHWVYYQKAPLVPLLRQGDLCRLGYPLALPPERMRTSVPGQEPWVAACKMISSNSSNKVEAPAAINLLLTRLAADHFSEIKKSPPLLYHNDLSARASRFYWSEDFGYALWLRLYYQSRSVRNGGAISASY